jgi:predicted ABC-type transport system involved in lysophospholipase L1 biosynthesis ATPase subunit
VTPAVLEFAGTSKAYGGLRPLRIAGLRLAAGDRVAILGFDQPSAEVFVNLATGATLPDAGEVSVFGRATRAIDNPADWLATVDRFGIVSERAVLLDALTVIQNLAMPFTLEIEPPPGHVRERAELLAREVGLAEASWTRPVAELDAAGWLRVRFGRAIALEPAILLLEHASARLPREHVAAAGAHMRAVAAARGMALVAATADEVFAKAVAERVLTLEPATGRLKAQRRWFG